MQINRHEHMRTFDQYITLPTNEINSIINNNQYIITSEIVDDILIINGLFDQVSCKKLIFITEPYYETMTNEFDLSYRDSERFLTLDKSLCRYLYDILKPSIEDYFYNTQTIIKSTNNKNRPQIPYGFGVQGKWKPIGINECFRFSRYKAPSVGFDYHRDSLYVADFNQRSIYTILIYLNDNFEGGKTSFVETLNERKIGQTVKEEMIGSYKKTTTIEPMTGKAIIFSHNRIHCGEPLNFGMKYVIRSDIVFEREPQSLPDGYNQSLWLHDSSFINAVNFYQDAKRYEMKGDVKNASICYERGLSYRQMSYI